MCYTAKKKYADHTKNGMNHRVTLSMRFFVGNVNSLEWNDGLERWNGLLEWSTGLDYWSATPINQRMRVLNVIWSPGWI